MKDLNIISLVGNIGFVLVALSIVFALIVYKLDILHLKSNTSIKTGLLKGQMETELLVDLE